VLAVVGLLFIIYHLGFEMSLMTTDSMAPTLRGTNAATGDRILIEKLTGWCRAPKRWEIISFYQNDGVLVMKRVIGLPGETVAIRNNQIYINDQKALLPSYLHSQTYLAYGNLHQGRAAACGNGYYVLGDDSRDSNDSRFEGPVPPEAVRGRAWLILGPANRLGFIH
jgi:signal peptidase I